jgi:hypothetical protein
MHENTHLPPAAHMTGGTGEDWGMTEQARGLARRLVAVTRGETAPVLDAPLELLAGPAETPRLRAVLGELVSATGAMLLQRADEGTDHTHLLDLHDADGRVVTIEKVAPPVRALVRAVLAHVNGHPGDADVQIELSVRTDDGDPVTVLVLALLWTVTALEWCEENDAEPPAWLIAA